MELKEEYCVYVHVYDGSPFYVGSGQIYTTKTGLLRGRPYDYRNGRNGRSKKWLNFCNSEKDKVVVQILFITNDKQESVDKEEEITRIYMEAGFPLVNKYIGTRWGEEQKKNISGENHHRYGVTHSPESIKKMSEAQKGKVFSKEQKRKMSETRKGSILSDEHRRKLSENHAKSKKVLVINNESGESKIFDSITRAYGFISQHGFDKTKTTLNNYLKKGAFTFNDYTLERIA